MRNLIYLFIFTVGILACSTDNETKSLNSDLIGNWDWTNTDGGIAFHMHETPQSTGTNFQLILNSDSNYSFLENGIEISSGTYEITVKESILTNEIERFINYTSNFSQPQNITVAGMVNIYEDSNKLAISQDFPDGIGSTFEKN